MIATVNLSVDSNAAIRVDAGIGAAGQYVHAFFREFGQLERRIAADEMDGFAHMIEQTVAHSSILGYPRLCRPIGADADARQFGIIDVQGDWRPQAAAAIAALRHAHAHDALNGPATMPTISA